MGLARAGRPHVAGGRLGLCALGRRPASRVLPLGVFGQRGVLVFDPANHHCDEPLGGIRPQARHLRALPSAGQQLLQAARHGRLDEPHQRRREPRPDVPRPGHHVFHELGGAGGVGGHGDAVD